jgi:hypothetical protein
MTDTLPIVDRLRGIYRIPITDGLGPVGGSEEPDNPNEFVRRFPSTPIQEQAADAIEMLVEALEVHACSCSSLCECPCSLRMARDALEKVRAMK